MPSNYDKQVDIGRKYFLNYDPDILAEKFALNTDAKYLYLTYIGEEYRIDKATALVEKNAGSWIECRSYNSVMTIYDFLCHGKDETPIPLSGEWMPIGRFVISGANPDADAFSGKYARAFSEKTQELKKACTSIGAKLLPRLAGADVTAEIPVFSGFCLLFQFWDGDEEFEPQIKILWDKNTLKYLNFETTYFLQGDILDRLSDAVLLQKQKRSTCPQAQITVSPQPHRPAE